MDAIDTAETAQQWTKVYDFLKLFDDNSLCKTGYRSESVSLVIDSDPDPQH